MAQAQLWHFIKLYWSNNEMIIQFRKGEPKMKCKGPFLLEFTGHTLRRGSSVGCVLPFHCLCDMVLGLTLCCQMDVPSLLPSLSGSRAWSVSNFLKEKQKLASIISVEITHTHKENRADSFLIVSCTSISTFSFALHNLKMQQVYFIKELFS